MFEDCTSWSTVKSCQVFARRFGLWNVDGLATILHSGHSTWGLVTSSLFVFLHQTNIKKMVVHLVLKIWMICMMCRVIVCIYFSIKALCVCVCVSNRAHSLYLRRHSWGQRPWDFLWGFWLWRSARHSSVVMVAVKTLTLAEWGNRQFFQSSICFCQKMPQELHIMTWNACHLIDSLQFGIGTPALYCIFLWLMYFIHDMLQMYLLHKPFVSWWLRMWAKDRNLLFDRIRRAALQYPQYISPVSKSLLQGPRRGRWHR